MPVQKKRFSICAPFKTICVSTCNNFSDVLIYVVSVNSSGGNFDSSFDAEKGVGTIVIAKPLDAEQRSIYNMSVEVTDGTNVAVTQVRCQLIKQ